MKQTRIEDYFTQTKSGKSEAVLLPKLEGGLGMNVISPDTVASLLRGELNISEFLLLDCRFDYEFDGGHLQQAHYANSQDSVLTLLRGKNWDNVPIILYCEFSQFRGPAMAKWIRVQDRTDNIENYPLLCYPELYLMQGGYSEFFAKYSELCEPYGYVTCNQRKSRKALTEIRNKTKLMS